MSALMDVQILEDVQAVIREGAIHVALFDQIARATVVLLLAWIVSRLLRRASASVRHQVWTVALIGVALLPLLSLTLPTWQLPLLTSVTESLLEPSDRYEMVKIERELTPMPTSQGALSQPPSSPQTWAMGGSASRPVGLWQRLDLSTWCVLLWALGTAFFLTRLLVSYVAAWKVSRDAVPVTDEHLLNEVAALRRQLGIRSKVLLVEHAGITMPMAWGLARQTILLPTAARDWNPERRRVVLLHELAHLKRWDCRTVLPARLVRALHWFNPLAWIAMSRLQAEREFACDDLVLTAGTPGPDYAQHLLDIARAMQPSRSPNLAMVAMARPSELEGRLLAILDPSQERGGKGRPARVAACLAVGLLVLPLASLQLSAEGAADPGDDPVGHGAMVSDGGDEPLDPATRARVLKAYHAALEDEDSDMRTQAAHALGTIEDSESVGRLGEALRDEEATVREQAAWALGMIEDASAVPMLASVLEDPSSGVRTQAVWALGMIESEAAVADLIRIANDASPEVRQQLAWALGMIESDAAVATLERTLGDEEAQVREQAAWALGMIESPSAVGALSSALADDPSSAVRRQAAWALGMIGHDSALDTLLNAMSDTDKEVQKQAFWAVGRIAD